MSAHAHRRPRRTPKSSEEVAHIIELKKRREHILLLQFKKSLTYRIQNIFMMCCVFVFWELIICFFGPCSYTMHFSQEAIPKHSIRFNEQGVSLLAELKMKDVNAIEYNIMVDDYIGVPPKFSKFWIGSDFLLGKNLRGIVNTSNKSYRVFTASPILLLSTLALIISLIAILSDLNHNPYSLTAICVLNGLALLAILSF